jgi:NitT/TauT family transport system ATP-binding protein
MNLNINAISKTYTTNRKTTLALDNVSLTVKSGEIVCLLGPSGCGKTTLLNIIAGFDFPDRGEVTANGIKIERPSTDRVLMFQESALFPWLTVKKNVGFGLSIKNIDMNIQKQMINETLETVHLSGFENAYIHELSGGMKQRVALARALILKPSVLLMDEPLVSLDALTRDKLHEEIQLIWQKTRMSIINVTHNIREALILGDRVAMMSASPGTVKKELTVNLPRPRHFEDPGIVELARVILEDLWAESALAERQAYDNR